MTYPIRFVQLPKPIYMTSLSRVVMFGAPYVVRAVALYADGDVDADVNCLAMPIEDRGLRRRLGTEALRLLGSPSDCVLAGSR